MGKGSPLSLLTVLSAPLHATSHPQSLTGSFLQSCLQSYKHSTEAPHWQARHIQNSAEPEAVGQTNMNASQYTASPTAHNEPRLKHSECDIGTGFISYEKKKTTNILRD